MESSKGRRVKLGRRVLNSLTPLVEVVAHGAWRSPAMIISVPGYKEGREARKSRHCWYAFGSWGRYVEMMSHFLPAGGVMRMPAKWGSSVDSGILMRR